MRIVVLADESAQIDSHDLPSVAVIFAKLLVVPRGQLQTKHYFC